MSHLRCVPHKRRVLVLLSSRKVIHRSDNSRCEADKLEHRGRVMKPGEVGPGAGA